MLTRERDALKLLGVEDASDPARLWQNYVDRLSALQTELIKTTSEARQGELQVSLAKLVAAYQLLRTTAQLGRRGTGPRTQPPLVARIALNTRPPEPNDSVPRAPLSDRKVSNVGLDLLSAASPGSAVALDTQSENTDQVGERAFRAAEIWGDTAIALTTYPPIVMPLLLRAAHGIGLTNLSDVQVREFAARRALSRRARWPVFVKLLHILGLTNLSDAQVRAYCSSNEERRIEAAASGSPAYARDLAVSVADRPSVDAGSFKPSERTQPAAVPPMLKVIPMLAAAMRPPPAAPRWPAPVERVDTSLVTPVRAESEPAANIMTPWVIRPGVLLQGRYEIETLLGDGGMGRVYAARDHRKGEDVAIKVLRSELLNSMAARSRFLSEARVWCRLAHPNIVRVFDVGIADGRYFFTMERLSGKTLRERIQQTQKEQTPFPLGQATAIAHQLLNALRHAHRYIVHRDLKPENVWIGDNGVVKLMDFGVSRAYVQTEVTTANFSPGTPYYMAPEQLMNANDVDWRADQYAFGVLMYEMLTGQLPIGVIQSLERVRRDIPAAYARAIMRALSARPEHRFPSLRELQDVLLSDKPVDLVDSVFSAMAQALLFGSAGGTVFAYLESVAQQTNVPELIFPSSIAIGVGTVLVLKLCEAILRFGSLVNTIAAVLASVLWIGAVLFFSQRTEFSDGLVMLLCGSSCASIAALVTRRWSRSSARRHQVQAAVSGALLGSLLGLMLLMQSYPGGRNLWLTVLSGFIPALILSIGLLRKSITSTEHVMADLADTANTVRDSRDKAH